ncbi:MAG: hypothetical protein GX153_11435 [Clostridiaceae bacterium]|jgi:hypothetical protein|nr:hypothetical protein [Clostridiaceae bacterium]
MTLQYNGYELMFAEGGVGIYKYSKALYFNKRPLHVEVKTACAVTEFYNGPYAEVEFDDRSIVASGELATPAGSVFRFADTYSVESSGFRVTRTVQVVRSGGDLGFASKISFVMPASDRVRDYDCFAPGVWYQQNEYAPEYALGKDLDCEYFWCPETACALPLFAAQHIATGEAVAISRWASDVTMRSTESETSENFTDPTYTIGSVGMSRPEPQTLNYTYYGYAVRRPFEAQIDGLSIDYVYPGAKGQMPSASRYAGLDFKGKPKTFQRINHPVTEGFTQQYSVAVHVGRYDGYKPMMRDVWRRTYNRMRDDLFAVDNKKHFHNCLRLLRHYTKQYGDSWGLPFACQLPDMDENCVSFQFGFVGQQPGIGYQLLRYGALENDREAYEKGLNILEFWVRAAMTPSGLPQMCYNPGMKGFEPYPHYTRMLADGVEAILDAYLFMKKQGEDKPAWLGFCRSAADWLVGIQNPDGSFYRAYNADNSIRMDSKSNTPSVIRFLVAMEVTTGELRYLEAALRAGEWSFDNCHRTLEYRGGTCDNRDIQDKEAGIYGIFGFMSLYDRTGDGRWLEGAIGAADYTETWTYAWKFPVRTHWAKHPFNQYSISGQSIITVGGGADVYMAACSYAYYRLYLITKDEHYLDFAEFIDKNTRQSNDIDGSTGYAMPGLGHESGNFTTQTLQSHYHWLPWCTFVEVDPTSRLVDTFGVYEIADAQKLPLEEREKKNRIYDPLA